MADKFNERKASRRALIEANQLEFDDLCRGGKYDVEEFTWPAKANGTAYGIPVLIRVWGDESWQAFVMTPSLASADPKQVADIADAVLREWKLAPQQ